MANRYAQKYGGAGGYSVTPLAPPDPDKQIAQDLDIAVKRQTLSEAPRKARQTQIETELKEAELARGGLTAQQYKELVARREMLPSFEAAVDELERQFQANYAGEKGAGLGIGGDVNLAARVLPDVVRPQDEQFRTAADSLIGTIASIQGATGGEMNSLAEMRARFGPLLPAPGDSDATMKQKIAGLRAMAETQRRALAAQIGEAPAASDEGADATRQRVGSLGAGDQVSLADGDKVRTEIDPALAGVNTRVNAMLKEGKDRSEIVAYLKGAGVDPDSDPKLATSLVRAFEFRQKNPNYKGDYSVDLESRTVPIGDVRATISDLANSPGGAAAIAMGNVVTGNRLDNLVELTGGDGELANIGMDIIREENPGWSLAGDVAGGMSLYSAGRAALSRLPGVLSAPSTATFARPALAGDAALGGYIASGAEGTDPFSAAAAAGGALAGTAGGVIGRGALNAGGRALSPTGGELAPAYAEGVKPTIGQRLGGIFDRAEQAFASIPAVGGIQRSARNRALKEWQAGAFNRSLREIGEKLPKGVQSGTAAHRHMQQAFNKAYDKARSGMTFRPDGEFAQDFGAVQQEVAALSDQSQRAFTRIVKEVGTRLRARGGVLDGDNYKTAVSKIEAKVRSLRKNPQGDRELADALEGVALALDKGARRHSSPEAAAALDAADRGYASAVMIEEAGRRAGGGDAGEFTGKQLEAAIRGNSGLRSRKFLSGKHPDQDYAAAGVRLGDNLADSGTPERLMTAGGTLGGMGSLAHFVDPITLTPWLADTVANLPGGRQAVNLLLAPNRKALDPARQHVLERAHIGGLLVAAPAAGAVSQ